MFYEILFILESSILKNKILFILEASILAYPDRSLRTALSAHLLLTAGVLLWTGQSKGVLIWLVKGSSFIVSQMKFLYDQSKGVVISTCIEKS